ncbi:hypothetical protein ACWEQA_30795 [Nocardia sp. NPDC004085]
MKPDQPADQTPPTARTTPPEPRPCATPGTLLGHLILQSAFHRPR